MNLDEEFRKTAKIAPNATIIGAPMGRPPSKEFSRLLYALEKVNAKYEEMFYGVSGDLIFRTLIKDAYGGYPIYMKNHQFSLNLMHAHKYDSYRHVSHIIEEMRADLIAECCIYGVDSMRKIGHQITDRSNGVEDQLRKMSKDIEIIKATLIPKASVHMLETNGIDLRRFDALPKDKLLLL